MAKQLEKKNKAAFSGENLIVIYKEGETPTFRHSSSNVFYISDKNLSKIFETVGLNQRPILITVDEVGKVTEKITSWLELM